MANYSLSMPCDDDEDDDEDDEYTNLSFFSLLPAAFYSYIPHLLLPSLSHYTLIVIIHISSAKTYWYISKKHAINIGM